MTPHPAFEQLVLLGSSRSEPGLATVRAHVRTCPQCQEEIRRLEQRVARIRALPTLEPGRDGWPAIRARYRAERRARLTRWVGGTGAIGIAASFVLVFALQRDAAQPFVIDSGGITESQISAVREQSAVLEATLSGYDPDSRVIDGRTARLAQSIEERIANVDQQLFQQAVSAGREEPAAVLDLWKERVGLLDALVDVHLTSGHNVGM